MSGNTASQPVVYMFEEDYEHVIKSTVLKHQDSETGGDLFGLWTSNRRGLQPLVHIVLGPGKNCNRTKYSFYQDVPYLRNVGSTLANDYMLGHIGEWHSHHRLTLCEPSAGDYRTVRKNYPSGYHGFLLIIANILPDMQVTLSPFLFREHVEDMIRGRVELIPGRSPFRGDSRIMEAVNRGAEGRLGQVSRTPANSGVASTTQIVASRSGNLRTESLPEQRRPLPTTPTEPNSWDASSVQQHNVASRPGNPGTESLPEQRRPLLTTPTEPNNWDASSVQQHNVASRPGNPGTETLPEPGSLPATPTEPNNGDASSVQQHNDDKGIDNQGLEEEAVTSPNGAEGTGVTPGDVDMPPEFWYRAEDRDKKLGDMLEGVKWLSLTSEDPFSLSFTFSDELGKKKVTDMLSKLQEIAGDEKIKLAFAFNRDSKRWTVELPADFPRSPITLQCVNQNAQGQAKAEIKKDNIQEVINEISKSFKMHEQEEYV